MRIRPFLVIPIVLASLVGCGRPAEDASKVLANVGGAKITEAELGKLVRALIKDPVQAKEFLAKDDKRAERNALLEQMATSKAVFQLAQAEGLDKDARVKAQIESAVAQVYFNSLLERRAGAVEPKDADLKAQYDTLAAQAKAAGETTIPPLRAGQGPDGLPLAETATTAHGGGPAKGIAGEGAHDVCGEWGGWEVGAPRSTSPPRGSGKPVPTRRAPQPDHPHGL